MIYKYELGAYVEHKPTGHLGIITNRRNTPGGIFYKISTYPIQVKENRLKPAAKKISCSARNAHGNECPGQAIYKLNTNKGPAYACKTHYEALLRGDLGDIQILEEEKLDDIKV